mgnify:CR=1 FL=1
MALGKFYTKDYTGETVSQNVSWKNRNDPSSMVWAEKTILNEDHNGVAHIIGNSKSRLDFDLNLIKYGQTGGADGVKSVGQTYGCNLLYKDFAPDFLVCTNRVLCKELSESEYCKDNIVFSNVKNILEFSNCFHLYPNFRQKSTGALALQLACADGHKKIFLLGMTTYTDSKDNVYHSNEAYGDVHVQGANNKFVNDCANIFLLYDDVQFYYVAEYIGLMPEAYNWIPNVKEINKLQYYNLASLGAVAH